MTSKRRRFGAIMTLLLRRVPVGQLVLRRNQTNVFATLCEVENYHPSPEIGASRWRHQMETFSALLALREGNHQSQLDSPHKGPWRGALMFDLRLNKRFGQTIETPVIWDAITLIMTSL